MDNKNLANSLFMKVSQNTDFSNNNILGYSREKITNLESKYNSLKESQNNKDDSNYNKYYPKENNTAFSLIIEEDEKKRIKTTNLSYLNPSLLMKKSRFHDSIYKKNLSFITNDINKPNSNINDNNTSTNLNLKENENTQNRDFKIFDSIKKSSNELINKESNLGRKICLNENINSSRTYDGSNKLLKTSNGVLNYIEYSKKIIRTILKCSNPMISIEKELVDSCKISTIKNYIKKYIEETFNDKIQSIELIFNNIIIDDDNIELKEFYNYTIEDLMEKKSLNSSGSDLSLTSHNEHYVSFRFDIKYFNEDNDNFSCNRTLKSHRNMYLKAKNEDHKKLGLNKKKKLVMTKDLPIVKNFKTIPDLISICRMSYDELENIYNFTVYNEHGSIKFLGVTNICRLNIDDIISIKENCIEVYYKRLQNNEELPEIGTELNKKAEITLFNVIYDESLESLEEFIRKIKIKIKSIHGDFIRYDINKKELTFGFDHFNYKN